MRIPALGLKRKQWEPLAFASPSMALIAFVILFPLAYSFYLSFQNFDLSVGPEYEFVGVKNYTEALFRDERFMGSVWNTALLIAPSLVLELLLGLGIALLLSRVLRGRPIITALLVVPSMVSPVMAAMACRMMYGVTYGAINNLGRQLGIIDVYFDWFSSPLVSAAKEWDKITERRGPDKQKAAWGEKLAEMMKQLGIEYHADWAAKAK
jgi:ABC-type sugar transport system permease subunit